MEEVESKKSWIVSLILCFFFGIFGIHNFYAKKIKIGIIQLITLGGLGIWSLIDLFYIIQQKYKDKDGNIIKKKESENEVLKLVMVFMIISVIGGSVYIFRLVNGVNNIINSDFVKSYGEVVQQEPGMQVFLYSDATQKQIDEIEEKIRSIDGVLTTEYVSKEEALNKMKEKFEDKLELSEYEGKNNIFSASFIVKIKDQSKYEKIYEKIGKLSNVKRVIKNDVTIERVTMIAETINIMFIFLIILIIMIIINILGKISVIVLILKKGMLKN